MSKKLFKYKGWIKINELKDKLGDVKKLEEILNDFAKNYFKSVPNALHMSIGFVHPEIFAIYKTLKNIYLFLPKSPEKKLQSLLEEQFTLLEKHNVYLYKMVQEETGDYEIKTREQAIQIFRNFVKKKRIPYDDKEKMEENLCKLYTKYTSYYLAVYYGNVFLLDSFLIFKKNRINEGVIIFVKSYLQYLAGYLMFQISIMQSLRSAVAAIMSRNMSHNIGSHILFYLKMEKVMDLFLKIVSKNRINYKDLSQKIQELIEKLNQNQYNLNSSLNSVKDTLEELERLLKSLSADIRWGILEWIEDTKTFFGYLQQRMDFLAQVSTEWPKWTFSAYLMKDIIRNFLMQRHLLDGIGKSEGLRGFYYEWEKPYKKYLKYKAKLEKARIRVEENLGRIKFHIFNLSKIGDVKDNQVKELWNKKHKSIYVRKKQLNNSRVLLYSSDKDSHINIEKDIPIAIPGGVIGYHALYVIIENIIRNSAKHGYTKKRGNKGDLEIVIEFTDDFKEPYNYWRFRIYDNVSKIKRSISRNKRFRIFDVNEKNKTPETDLVAFMNECLRHSLIKETGEIDKRHWGMAEMKIAAGYLQMRDVQDIGEKDDKITSSMEDQNGEREDFIIRAIESPIGTLGFEFKVKKPKEVGIVFYGGIK